MRALDLEKRCGHWSVARVLVFNPESLWRLNRRADCGRKNEACLHIRLARRHDMKPLCEGKASKSVVYAHIVVSRRPGGQIQVYSDVCGRIEMDALGCFDHAGAGELHNGCGIKSGAVNRKRGRNHGTDWF